MFKLYLFLHLFVFPLGQKEVKVEWSMGHISVSDLGKPSLIAEEDRLGDWVKPFTCDSSNPPWLDFLGGLIFISTPRCQHYSTLD